MARFGLVVPWAAYTLQGVGIMIRKESWRVIGWGKNMQA